MAQRMPLEQIAFISEFAAFCRSKGDEEYDFGNPNHCALAQFVIATGRGSAETLPLCKRVVEGSSGNPFDPCGKLSGILNPGSMGRYTFRAVADKLEALIADAPVVVKG